MAIKNSHWRGFELVMAFLDNEGDLSDDEY
jgi:hypothetical protein